METHRDCVAPKRFTEEAGCTDCASCGLSNFFGDLRFRKMLIYAGKAFLFPELSFCFRCFIITLDTLQLI